MRRRLRALGFAATAIACALLALLVIGRQNPGLADTYGDLREVVVLRAEVAAGQEFDAAELAGLLEVRRVPAAFVAPDALTSRLEATGMVAAVDLPAGGYLTSTMLKLPGEEGEAAVGAVLPWEGRLAPGQRAVEVGVQAGGHLVDAGSGAGKVMVDVFVTGPQGGGRTRTRLVAPGVEVLDFAAAGKPVAGDGEDFGEEEFAADPYDTGGVRATLAVDMATAIRLIDADATGQRVTLLAAEAGK